MTGNLGTRAVAIFVCRLRDRRCTIAGPSAKHPWFAQMRLSDTRITLGGVGQGQRLDWQYRADYIRTRSQRRVDDTDIEPEWADEAFADPAAIVESPDHASKSGQTDRLAGCYSPTARIVIVVVYLRDTLIGVQRVEGQRDPHPATTGSSSNEQRRPEKLIDDETEQAERTRDEPMTHGVRRGPTRTEVYSLRMAPEEVEEIQRIADAAGIPASGLVRDWVRQGLAAERDESMTSAVQALERDLHRLKRQLAA